MVFTDKKNWLEARNETKKKKLAESSKLTGIDFLDEKKFLGTKKGSYEFLDLFNTWGLC